MSQETERSSFFEEEADHGPRPRRTRGFASCLIVLVVLALVGGGASLALFSGMDRITDALAGPEDYSGDGSGSVTFEVESGESSVDIARKLKAAGVVKSVEAFTEAASDDAEAARGIQVGFYEMRRKMSAASALEVLVDPANLVQTTVTVPEGLRVPDTLKVLAKGTGIPLKKFQSAIRKDKAIGLPGYARGNPEGYLFPATYPIAPNATASDILAAMVTRWRQAADEASLEQRADELGYTPGELMVVASLVESEANRRQDRGKVARVIYNRLETDATNGLLQIDATVNYALGRDLGLNLTTEDLQVDSPYNTRRYPGLPPGPIESPGDAAIAAAANPTPGPWVYYATVNLDTGETKFAEDYEDFLGFRRELEQFCATSDRC